MSSAGTRFSHLLQPIRDLTENWDVDLASQLGEYLEELDQMTISFDRGKTTVNFAEAALLIQGSTCVYIRKVELLHNLVFQTLDRLSSKTKRRNKQVAEATDGVSGGTAASEEVDDCEFDLIEEECITHSVDMKSAPTEPVNISRLPFESLIPAEAHEKQKYPLFSIKGEVLGSCRDFRINNFSPDSLGIIRLGPSSSCVRFQRKASGDNAEGMVGVANDAQYEGDYAGFEPLPPLEEENEMETETEREEHVERHQAPREKRLQRERPKVHFAIEEPKQLQETVDPWKWHDPYEDIGTDKPLKTGKCYNVPAGLDDSGKRKRTGPCKLQDFSAWWTSVYEDTECKFKNGPLHSEFNYIYLSKMNQRLKTRKGILKKTGVYVSDEVLKRTYLEPEQQEDQNEVARHPDMDGEDFSDHENENLFEDHAPGEVIEQDPIFPDSQVGQINYEDLVKKSVELFLMNSQKYDQETALSRRVKEWEDEINPRLSAQEDSIPFDIHDYGDRIVQALGTIGTKRSLASLVNGMENTEACRYMLASLQLANDYTVEIDQKAGLEESIDTMELTLLSTQRAHERFNTYNTSSDPELH